MRPYKFLIKGKKCQNDDEGKQKTAIAVRTILDSAYKKVVWSPLMIFLCCLTNFFISMTKDVLYQLHQHCLCCNTIAGKTCQRKTLSKENLEKVAITGNGPLYIIGFFLCSSIIPPKELQRHHSQMTY